jgi:hypothetical protein
MDLVLLRMVTAPKNVVFGTKASLYQTRRTTIQMKDPKNILLMVRKTLGTSIPLQTIMCSENHK